MAKIEQRNSKKPEAPKPYRVFLSHAFRDAWVAGMIAEKIRQKGGEVWLDINELTGGDTLYSRILSAVDTCDEAVVLLSPHSIRSNWVLFEIGAVCGQHKRITPVLDHVEPAEVPVIAGIRSIDINQLEHSFLPELTRRISEQVQEPKSLTKGRNGRRSSRKQPA